MFNRLPQSLRRSTSSTPVPSTPAATPARELMDDVRAPIAPVQDQLMGGVPDFGGDDPELARAVENSLYTRRGTGNDFEEDPELAWAIESSISARNEHDDFVKALELSKGLPASSSRHDDELELAMAMSLSEATASPAVSVVVPSSSSAAVTEAQPAPSIVTTTVVPSEPVNDRRAAFLAAFNRRQTEAATERNQAAATKPKQTL